MTEASGPFDLAKIFAVLDADSSVTTRPVGPDLYRELDAEFDGFKGCALVAEHSFSDAWGTWEMHPGGDELVYLLDGDVDFILWRDAREEILHVGTPGSYVVVPRGIWHTARPHKPSKMLFVTPGEGTQHAETPPGD